MPPRKSDVSKVGEGDEGTPAKEAPLKEGINIEVPSLPFHFQDILLERK